jgi:DNA-binding GntR family transcriptional regulator
LRLRSQLYDQSERYRRLSIPLARIERNVQDEHQSILQATLARDAETAAGLLAAHLQATTKILLSATSYDEMQGAEDTED